MSLIRTPPSWLRRYNLLSAFLWALLLVQATYWQVVRGQPDVFQKTHSNLILVETFALVELYASVRAYVSSSVFTTFTQLFARFFIIWALFYRFSDSAFNNSTRCYFLMVVAWAVTEVIRYNYYAANMSTSRRPSPLLSWLRYTAFIVLYPLGLFCEASIFLGNYDRFVGSFGGSLVAVVVFYGLMSLYVPGFYLLYTHMLRQRRKALRRDPKTAQ